jgi:DHA1 family 2-module integral membrane pump EmrD-like MFS transporter
MTALTHKTLNPIGIGLLVMALITMGQMGIDIYLPSLPAMTEYFHTDSHFIQLTLATYLLGLGAPQLVYGPLSDYFGRRPILLTGMAICLIGSVLCLFAPSALFLLAARLLQGIGAGATGVSARAIMRDSFEGNALAKMASYITMAWALVPIIAPILGGYIQAYFGWKMNFIFLLLFAMLLTALLIKWLPETNKKIKHTPLTFNKVAANYLELLKSSAFMGNIGCIMILFGIFLAFNATGPFLLQTQLGLSPIEYSWTLVFVACGYLLGSFFNSKLVQRFLIQHVVIWGFIALLISAGSLLAFCLEAVFNVAVIIVPMFLVFFSIGLIYANCIMGCLKPFPHIAGVTGALYGFLGCMGSSLATTIIAHFPVTTQKPLVFMVLLQAIASLVVYSITLWNVKETVVKPVND